MKKNNPTIKVEIVSLDNGYIVTEQNIDFAFQDFAEVSQWLEEALQDERKRKEKDKGI
jgi:hypothetical protein